MLLQHFVVSHIARYVAVSVKVAIFKLSSIFQELLFQNISV